MDNSIGDLFRNHGEEYISIYKPPINHIKLIRAIRVCRTPALGGKRVICKNCGHTKHIHLSCGHSQCPLCQNVKREIWQQKLADKFLAVPYVHTVFTIPHELNKLAKLNKQLIYNITMRAAWLTIKKLTADPKNVGGLPGMVSVLHTFGSDMKYHIHVHALITFGGLDAEGNWVWPKRKKQLASYRKICKTYRETFLSMLEKHLSKGELVEVNDMDELLATIKHKRWNVRNEYPTTDTAVLEQYLSRYINRIAISKSRLEYVAAKQNKEDAVLITYKDYRKQKKENLEIAPKAIKTMESLAAIHQFMLHVLPPYFQKSRHQGLHSAITYKRLKDKMSPKLKRNGKTVRVIFQILNHLNGLEGPKCEECQHEEFEILPLPADVKWIFNFITVPTYRGPPKRKIIASLDL